MMGWLVDWYYRRFKGETENQRLMRHAKKAMEWMNGRREYIRRRYSDTSRW